MYRTLLARCEYRVCSHWVYNIVCHFHDSHTLLEGVWLSDIGRMVEVRNIPHLACSKFADESGEVASSDLAASKNN